MHILTLDQKITQLENVIDKFLEDTTEEDAITTEYDNYIHAFIAEENDDKKEESSIYKNKL